MTQTRRFARGVLKLRVKDRPQINREKECERGVGEV